MFLLSASAPEKAAKILRVKEQEKEYVFHNYFTSTQQILTACSISRSLLVAYQLFITLFHFLGATTIIAVTELAIRWNKISGVNSLWSAGQVIPLGTGFGCFARVVYLAIQNHRGGETFQRNITSLFHSLNQRF
jgi:hypothetical protein